MTKDEIIQMAEDCGIAHQYYEIKVEKKLSQLNLKQVAC
jgi:hypothetical protein